MKNFYLNVATATLISFTGAAGYGAVGTISGPFVHRNLQIFLIHGETQLEGRHYATLSEALAKGIVIVKETGNVSDVEHRESLAGSDHFSECWGHSERWPTGSNHSR